MIPPRDATREDLIFLAWLLWLVARANEWEPERYEARASILAMRRSTPAERTSHAREIVRHAVRLSVNRRACLTTLAGLLLATNKLEERTVNVRT